MPVPFCDPKYVALLFRWILGSVFVYASWDKIQHPADFARAVDEYQILPEIFVNIFAIILPWVELICGLSLIIGIFVGGSIMIINSLMVVFFVAKAISLYKGLEIGCGCFSVSDVRDTIGISYLLRDLVLIGMGLFIYFKTTWVPD